MGRSTSPVAFSIELVGATGSGAAPTVVSLTPTSSQLAHPVGVDDAVQAKFLLHYADPDGDVARLRWKRTRPDGTSVTVERSASTLAIAGADGTAELVLPSLRASDPSGAYSLEVILFDAGGRASAPATATFSLVDDPASLAVQDVAPGQGSAGAR